MVVATVKCRTIHPSPGGGERPVRDRPAAPSFQKAARLAAASQPHPAGAAPPRGGFHEAPRGFGLRLQPSSHPALAPRGRTASPGPSPNAAAPQAKTRRAPFRWDLDRGKAPVLPGTRAAVSAWLLPWWWRWCRHGRLPLSSKAPPVAPLSPFLTVSATAAPRLAPSLLRPLPGQRSSRWKLPPRKQGLGRIQVPGLFSDPPIRFPTSESRSRCSPLHPRLALRNPSRHHTNHAVYLNRV